MSRLFPSGPHERYGWLLPAVIVCVGLLLRGAYLAEISREPGFSHPLYDPEYNAYWARGLATGDWTVPPGVTDPEIRTTPHGRPPGYPWFLAGVYILFGVNDYSPRLVQMAVGLLNCLLLYSLGRRLFGSGVGFLCGLFMALYWVFPYFEGVLTYPSVVICVLLCMAHALSRWREKGLTRWALATGLLLGLFGLFRPNGLIFLPVLAAWMTVVGIGRFGQWRRSFIAVVLLCVGCVLVLAPAFIRNYIVARDVVFISSYGGINLYVGNHPEASLVEPRIPKLMELAGTEHWSCFDYPAIVRGLAAQEGRETMTFSEANSLFYRKALEFMRAQPGRFLGNMVRKSLLFWGPHEITNDTVMEYDKQFSRTLRWLPGFPWVAALFVAGSVVWAWNMYHQKEMDKNVRDVSLLLWLLVFAYFLSVVIYFVAGRYRVPVIPVLLLFGAYGVAHIFEQFRHRRWLRGAAWVAALLVLRLVFQWNFTGYEPARGTWHLRKALAWTAAGDEMRAREEYGQALAHGAESSLVYANLGRLHIEHGEIEQGLARYEEGLRYNPHNPIIRNNLGYELYRLGHLDAAMEHLEQAVAVNPRFALAHINLGHVLADAGHPAEALRHFRAAERISPGDPAPPYNSGRMRFNLGDLAGAIEDYERALRLDPDFVEALNNVGYAYASQGNLERAVAYYRRAVLAKPSFALAYNNLGNALAALGDSDGAADIYLEGLRNAPDDGYGHYNLACLLLRRGEQAEAREHLREAVRLLPEYVPALVQAGRLALESGDAEAAEDLLGRAARIEPDNPEIRPYLEAAPPPTGPSNE